MKKVFVWTDGGCQFKKGGYGVVLQYGKVKKLLYGKERDTTNNRMELTACIQALSSLKEKCEVELHTDSQYVRKGITEWIHGWIKRGWRLGSKGGGPVKNDDLWKELHNLNQRHVVKWKWVKGHNGNENNEIADALASEAIKELK